MIDDPTVFPVPLTLDTAIPPATAREFRLNIVEATGGRPFGNFSYSQKQKNNEK